MTLLKEIVENLINEDETNAKVNFHSYLTTKMKSITEMEMYEEKVQVPNEKANEFLDEAKKLFDYAKFKIVKEGDFHTTINIICHDQEKLDKAVELAGTFK